MKRYLIIAASATAAISSMVATAPVTQAAPKAVQAAPERILANPPPSHHLRNHNGYNFYVTMFGVGVLDYYEQETAYTMSVYNQDNYWADYLRLDDNPWLQLATTTVDRPNWGPLVADRLCHPVTGACVYNVSLSEHDEFVYAVFGWFGRYPVMRVFVLPTNQIGFMMVRNDQP